MAHDSTYPRWVDCHDLRRDAQASGRRADEPDRSRLTEEAGEDVDAIDASSWRDLDDGEGALGSVRLIDPETLEAGPEDIVSLAREDEEDLVDLREDDDADLLIDLSSEAESGLVSSFDDDTVILLDPEEEDSEEAALAAQRAEAAESERREAEAREQAKAAARAKAKAEAEAEAKRKAEAEAKAKAEALAKAKAEARARAMAEARAREEAEAREAEEARRAAEAKAREEAKAKALKAAQEKAAREKAKAEAEAKARAEAEARRKAEAAARKKAEEQAQRKAEAEAKRKAEEEARRKAEAEERARAEAKAKAEAEARAKAEAEAKAKAEARRKAEEEAKAKAAAEDRARREAEEQAQAEAEAEAKRAAEEAAKAKAGAEKAAAEKAARALAKAEAKAAKEAERKAREEAEAKAAREAAEQAAPAKQATTATETEEPPPLIRKAKPKSKPAKADIPAPSPPKPAEAEHAAPADLAETFRRLIRSTGPISLAQFMAESNARYYNSRDPLGGDAASAGNTGDFITAPEVSQMFGELIGLWLADLWVRMGMSDRVHYVELGPGRGTLATDALRAAGRYGFDPPIHFVEGSEALRKVQLEAFPKAIHHHDLSTLPDDRPLLIVANEFFDALPIHQLVCAAQGWHEKLVGLEGDDFVFVAGSEPMDALVPPTWRSAPQGTMIETSPAATALMAEISARLANQGGAALIIDYGPFELRSGSTLQAIKSHAHVDPLTHPGEADLTAHVDFELLQHVAVANGAEIMGIEMQGDWLRNLGIDTRLEALQRRDPSNADVIKRQYERLVADNQMGTLFKVLGICGRRWPIGVGFDPR
ncbi:MAG: SAM-dependent methyltransferase [Erythrobacter sp.]|jgi:SAM-dependent MidA family methyltransferase|nr:SAM-dependent methyltransferase [Erythrobacter sp.]